MNHRDQSARKLPSASSARRRRRPLRTASAAALVLAAIVAFTSPLAAQIDYPAFPSLDDLVLVGTAEHAPPVIQLNSHDPKVSGGVWFPVKQPVASGFTTRFSFQITDTAGQIDAVGLTGGDGLAFVIQNADPSPIGGFGGQLGYDPIRNSLAVEFDTYANNEPGFMDPNANHVSIQTTGRGTNSASHSYSRAWNSTFVPALSDGRVHDVMIIYRGGVLSVYIDGCQGLVVSTAIDLARELALDSGRAWVGFTAATGSAWERHALRSWQFNAAPLTHNERIGMCEGAAAELRVPGTFSSYRWSTGARTPTITVTRTGRYTVEIIDSSSCIPTTATWTFDVVVAPRPRPRIAPSSPMVACEGETVTLDAGDHALYRWSTGAVTRSITVRRPGLYWVEVTSALGCVGRSDTLPVVFKPRPTPQVTVAGPTSFCAGDSAVLDAGPGFVSYRWSSGETTRRLVVRSDGTYTVTVQDSTGCTATSPPVVVTVWPRPYPAIEVVGPRTVCAGEPVTLRSTGAYLRYRWSTGDTTPSIVVRLAGVYWLEVENAVGCRGVSQPVTIEARPAPTPRILADTIRRPCQPDSVVVRTSGTYLSYRWSNGATTPTISMVASDTISVEVVDSGGCVGSSATVTINVRTGVQVQTRIDGARDLCEGEEAMLRGPEGLDRYEWSTGERTPSIVVRTTGWYRLTGTDVSGCVTSDSVFVTVSKQPRLVVSPDTTICRGTEAVLRVSGADRFSWTPSGDLTCPDCATPFAAPQTTTRYTVVGINEGGCTDTAFINVTVLPAPETEVRIAGARAYPGEIVELPVTVTGPVNEAQATSFTFEASYDAHIMQLRGVVLSDALLSGWQIATDVDSTGYFRARLSAAGGGVLGPGANLLHMRFATFLGSPQSGWVRPTITLPDRPCASVFAYPGQVVLDSVCGVGLRMVEPLAGTYALRVVGGPLLGEVSSIEVGVPATARLVIDAFTITGVHVATVHDGEIPGGTSVVLWNTGDLAPGAYVLRARSGEWAKALVVSR